LQRLSTMFTCGWPRRALLLLRIGIVAILTQDGILAWMGALQREPISLHIVAAIAGVFLLLGLWTPVAGAIVALSEIGIVLKAHAHPQYTIPLQRKASLSHFWTGLSVHRRLHVWQKAYQYLSPPTLRFTSSKKG
jgi:uncharacterized membrane protein YphA (DoxX/SURF4 family)